MPISDLDGLGRQTVQLLSRIGVLESVAAEKDQAIKTLTEENAKLTAKLATTEPEKKDA